MINNITKTSSIFRLASSLIVIALYFTGVLTNAFGFNFATILFSLSGIVLVSGIFRTDPLKYVVRRIQYRNKI